MNVSVHKKSGETGELLPATRVELKNINSFNAILRATDGEIVRQKKLLHAAERVVHETRTYDQARNESTSLRSKEDQYDLDTVSTVYLRPSFLFDLPLTYLDVQNR